MIEKFEWFKINLWNPKKILNTKKPDTDQTKPDEGRPAMQAGGGDGGADGRFADKLEYNLVNFADQLEERGARILLANANGERGIPTVGLCNWLRVEKFS